MLATITFTPEERKSEAPHPDTVRAAATAMRTFGYVLLHGAFAPEFIDTLCQAHLARHEGLASGERPTGAGEVGNKRYMTALDFSPPFNTSLLYANPLVLPILESVLGADLIIGAAGVVTSLPGAKEQHCHRDGSALFNEAVNRISPPHAIDFFIPLVEFNETTGTTRLFPRTHFANDAVLKETVGVEPVIPRGSCMLMDYRLFHQGLENRSERARPLLFYVFHKPWFKDYQNHRKGPFLRLSESEYAGMRPEHRRLFAWTEHYRTGLY